jgi:hypothetical protein
MADFEIRIDDHSGELLKQFNERAKTALEAIGIQAESHAKQVITDTLVYGGIDLIAKGEKDNSRVDTGQLRNSITHTVLDCAAYIGTNVQHAVWNEIGTGIYASQPGGRQTPWSYVDRNGVGHTTRGMQPIHFLLKAASEHNDEYKAIIQRIMEGH